MGQMEWCIRRHKPELLRARNRIATPGTCQVQLSLWDTAGQERSSGQMAMGQNLGYPPVNIPIPTRIGSKMGGAPIPKWDPIGFEAWPNFSAERRRFELRTRRSDTMPWRRSTIEMLTVQRVGRACNVRLAAMKCGNEPRKLQRMVFRRVIPSFPAYRPSQSFLRAARSPARCSAGVRHNRC